MKREIAKSAGQRGRPSRLQAEQKRNQLLALARDCFLAHGFSAATIEHIAAASGVSKSTIYARFGGKEGLFRAVAKRSCQAPANALQNVITEGRSPQDVIAAFIQVLLTQSRDADSMALLRLAIFESPRFPDIAQSIYQASLEVLEPLRAYLRHLQHTGELGEGDTDLAAQDLVSLCSAGYRFLLVADPVDAPPLDAERILTVYLRSLGLRQVTTPKTNRHI